MKSKHSLDMITLVLIGSLLLMAIASLARILTKPGGGIDFYSYWLPGHFVWQRMDPYAAALEKRTPQLPIYYLDGPIATEFTPLHDPTPANTAPVVLLLALFSRVSWDTAFQIWKMLNLGLLGVISWSVLRLLGHRLFSRQGLMIVLIICSLIATRESLETGQTTLLTLACMMIALILGSEKQCMSGIFLGIALSKYSLTFPGILYFLCKRWYRGLVISMAVQCLGILAIAFIGRTTPLSVLREYVRIMLKHIDLPGMHLSATLLAPLGPYTSVIKWLITLSLIIALAYWYYIYRPVGQRCTPVTSVLLLVIIMRWNLLIFYHRRYDHVAEILFLALVMLWVNQNSNQFLLSVGQRLVFQGFAIFAASMWILPWYYLLGINLYVNLFSLCSLIALAMSVFLLFRSIPNMAVPT
jgi:hypothetical protein